MAFLYNSHAFFITIEITNKEKDMQGIKKNAFLFTSFIYFYILKMNKHTLEGLEIYQLFYFIFSNLFLKLNIELGLHVSL